MADDSNQGGGRSLGGGAQEPLPSSWATPRSSAPRIGRIGAWSSRDAGRTPNPNDRSRQGDDSDDNDGPDPTQEGASWFAGGERSGLSIENPDRARGIPGGNIVRDLLRRAAESGPPRDAPGTAATGRTNAFSGGGYKLGSDEVESSFVPDPTAPNTDATPDDTPVIRHLTFWRDGFSVEDGELMRYDDPENEQTLAEIHAGRAPPQILNVLPGQPVELRVTKRLTEPYAPTKRAATHGAFSGTGARLGAPTPHARTGSSGEVMPGTFPSSSSTTDASTSDISTKFEVDHTLPTTSVQIRLADGTRMVCRMNLTHTVMDLRNFINASRPENLTRPYTIGTTFPNRTLDDNTATIKDAGLTNSVIVQRWV